MSGGPAGPEISVIVVEDEPALRAEAVEFLSARGITVRAAADDIGLWRMVGERVPDVVVLDLGLPGEDGVAISTELRRRHPSLGIVMMTARGAVRDRIVGYETGANVYLVKPVDLGELVAAIRSTARHQAAGPDTVGDDQPRWTLDMTTWRLSSPEGKSIQLTRAETQVLDCLAAQPGVAVSRVEIGRRMGKADDLSDHRYVDQLIRRLRRKIEANLIVPAPIGSAHSQGYYFAELVAIHRI